MRDSGISLLIKTALLALNSVLNPFQRQPITTIIMILLLDVMNIKSLTGDMSGAFSAVMQYLVIDFNYKFGMSVIMVCTFRLILVILVFFLIWPLITFSYNGLIVNILSKMDNKLHNSITDMVVVFLVIVLGKSDQSISEVLFNRWFVTDVLLIILHVSLRVMLLIQIKKVIGLLHLFRVLLRWNYSNNSRI